MILDSLKKMAKSELLELARERRLRVTDQMTKAELVDLVASATKKSKEPAASKTPAKAVGKDKAQEEKRVEAAREAARKFIAGVKEKPRSKKRARPQEPRPAEHPRPATPSKPATPVKPATPAKPAMPVKPAPPARPAAEKLPTPQPPPAAKMPPAAKVPSPAKAAPAAKTPIAEKPPQVAETKPRTVEKKPPRAIAGKKPAARTPAAEKKKTSDEAIRQMAEEGKFYLGAEQRVMPPVEAIEIPAGYNVDRIVAMVRDPYWILTYWEITDHKYRELERHFGDTWPKCRMILRVYDKTNDTPTHFDIALAEGARNWYINVSAERRYQIAIGALSPDGRFEQIAISNIVETPSGRVSDRVDEHWMVPDDVFMKIFAASGGHDMHAASVELKGLLEKRLLEEISSGAVTSFGSGAWPKPEKGRKFRFWIATELILYGGTEPDAHVTVQGKEVKLRPDGTFSLRFALPDGKIGLPVTAASGDGLEERTIETNVKKKSEKKEPVLK